MDNNLFQFTFRRTKGCIRKKAVANKKDRHCSSPILVMWFDVLISYIIPMGDVFPIRCKRVGAI